MKKNLKDNLILFFLLLFLFFGVYPHTIIRTNFVNSAVPQDGLSSFASFGLGTGFALALEVNYPQLPRIIPPQNFPEEEILSYYIQYIFSLIIAVSGIIAFGALVYGGILYLISTGNAAKMASARDQISSAFFGILILLSSFLVLKIINPELSSLKNIPLQEIKLPEKRDVPAFSPEAISSSIEVALPFGRLIEGKIFESYVSEIPEPRDKIPRMTRIENNVRATLRITEGLRKQSENLNQEVLKCRCQRREIDIYCPSLCWGDPLPISCRCDPCEFIDENQRFRPKIEKLQQENLDRLNQLKEEQEKTIAEINDLKIYLNRLERAESFIKNCPGWLRDSYAQFLTKKDFLKENLRDFGFWSDIQIPYLTRENKSEPDWASFFCTIGGKSLSVGYLGDEMEEAQATEIEVDIEKILERELETEEEPTACWAEVPVGEVIDRTKRIGNLLVKRLENLVVLNKKMIDAVDRLHVLISKCNTQAPRCISVCDPLFCTPVRCVGPVGADGVNLATIKDVIQEIHLELAGGKIANDFLQIPSVPGQGYCWQLLSCGEDCWYWYFNKECYKQSFKDQFNKRMDKYTQKPPCPYDKEEKKYETEIQVEKITDILEGTKEQEGIKNVVQSVLNKEEKEKSGILALIDSKSPQSLLSGLFEDLEKEIRYPMQVCEPEKYENTLNSCQDSIGKIAPRGEKPEEKIKTCCLEEPVFQECLQECYLEKGDSLYKNCLSQCLQEKRQEAINKGIPTDEAEKITQCRHLVNFFCCAISK